MPSNFSTRKRFIKQATGEGANVWGTLLNDGAIEFIDAAIAGLRSIAVTGDYTITTSNLNDDDARYLTWKFTGALAAPATITVPSLEDFHVIWNTSGNTLTFTTGSGVTMQVANTDIVLLFCDGTNVKTLGYGGQALKDWISSAVSGGPGAVVPSPTGHDNQYLKALSGATLWASPTTSELADIVTYTRARKKQALLFSMIF